MGLLVRVTQPDWLEVVSALVHDCIFDVAHVIHSSDRREVCLGFELPGPRWSPPNRGLLFRMAHWPVYAAFLRVAHVESYTLVETVGVGRYDMTRLEYHREGRRLVMRTGIPLRFEMVVEALSVSVEVTSTVLREEQGRRLL